MLKASSLVPGREARLAAVTTLEMPHGRSSLEPKEEMRGTKGMDWGRRGRAHLLEMPRSPQWFKRPHQACGQCVEIKRPSPGRKLTVLKHGVPLTRVGTTPKEKITVGLL